MNMINVIADADTRWWSKVKVVSTIIQSPSNFAMVYLMIVNGIQISSKSQTKTLNQLANFWFKPCHILVVFMFMLQKILKQVHIPHCELQRNDVSVAELIPIINSVRNDLKDIYNDSNLSIWIIDGCIYVENVRPLCRIKAATSMI